MRRPGKPSATHSLPASDRLAKSWFLSSAHTVAEVGVGDGNREEQHACYHENQIPHDRSFRAAPAGCAPVHKTVRTVATSRPGRMVLPWVVGRNSAVFI